MEKARSLVLELLDLEGKGYSVLFLQGGASTQFLMTAYNILDKKIIKRKGGIGTYKNEEGFFNRQMIHFDSRGTKARWHR